MHGAAACRATKILPDCQVAMKLPPNQDLSGWIDCVTFTNNPNTVPFLDPAFASPPAFIARSLRKPGVWSAVFRPIQLRCGDAFEPRSGINAGLCLVRVAAAILADVEGGILPPGKSARWFDDLRIAGRFEDCIGLFRRAGCPADKHHRMPVGFEIC